jgi:anti-sigma28 factor (negative regulator of flagellin synthesis)
MAFNQSEKEQIEKMIRKEIKDFMDSNTVKQFENKLIDVLKKEIKDGKLRKDVRSVVSDVMVDFYRLMWTRRSFWEPDIRK